MQARTGDPTQTASPQATAVSQSAPTPAPAAAPVDDVPFKSTEEAATETATPAASEAPAAGGGAQDILAMIRSRQG